MGNHGFNSRALQDREQTRFTFDVSKKVARNLIMIKPTSPPAYVVPMIHAKIDEDGWNFAA
jgi:hypothetical protein